MDYKYKHSILGGTFDHLHIGHKKLIDEAFKSSEKVTLGLSTQNLYKEKFLSALIDPYETRESELKNYLQEQNYLARADIVPLEDIFGPSLKTKDINAIFVTETTLPNAKIINEKRAGLGLKPLEIVTVPFVNDETGKVITSERIRLGEINRAGRVYANLFKKDVLKLPASLREKLRRPIGQIIKDVKKIKEPFINKNSLLITVGDIVSKSIKELGRIPDIEIIDFKTRRSRINMESLNKYKNMGMKTYINEPGTISSEVVGVFKEGIKNCLNAHQKQTIIIEGEEDLLTLPAILLAPLHSIVYYGQFDLDAMVQVEVTEEKKEQVAHLLQKFQ